jgi:hypothetical protein
MSMIIMYWNHNIFVNQHSKWKANIFVEYSWSNIVGSSIKHQSTFQVEGQHLCSIFMKQYSGFKYQTSINIQSGTSTPLLNVHEAIWRLQMSIMYQWTWKFQLQWCSHYYPTSNNTPSPKLRLYKVHWAK